MWANQDVYTFFTEFRQGRNGVALEVQKAVGIRADFVAEQEALQRRVEDVGTLAQKKFER